MISKKSLAAFQGSSPTNRRQWRGCLLEEIGQAAAKGKAMSALCQITGLSRGSGVRYSHSGGACRGAPCGRGIRQLGLVFHFALTLRAEALELG
jgi:hypothetical protein